MWDRQSHIYTVARGFTPLAESENAKKTKTKTRETITEKFLVLPVEGNRASDFY